MLRILPILLLFLISLPLQGQELRCQINVTSSQVQGSNKTVFDAMRKNLYEFVNNKKWTDHVFDEDERIDCSFMFRITDQISTDEFRGSLTVQARRPVYGSAYTTTLLNHQDQDIHFRFAEFETLEFNETAHTSNLVSILAFYINIILGMDYDTFSMEGGSLFYERAEQIVSNAANAPETGWKAFESQKNRYWLVENLLNSKYEAFRSMLYNYHRLGLDVMTENPNDGRSVIGEALTDLRKPYRENTQAMIWPVFFTSKADEISNIFSEGFPDEKARIVQVLKEISPANSSKWDNINKSGDI
jgi:hypothetical protein